MMGGKVTPEMRRRHYEANKARVLAKNRAWAEANPEKAREHKQRWRDANPERQAAAYQQWLEANPEKERARLTKRRAALLDRTPNWDAELTEFVTLEAADLAAKREQATGFPWDVDHTVPLRGQKVSGLHVWNNLQVIPASANRSKGNKFEV